MAAIDTLMLVNSEGYIFPDWLPVVIQEQNLNFELYPKGLFY